MRTASFLRVSKPNSKFIASFLPAVIFLIMSPLLQSTVATPGFGNNFIILESGDNALLDKTHMSENGSYVIANARILERDVTDWRWPNEIIESKQYFWDLRTITSDQPVSLPPTQVLDWINITSDGAVPDFGFSPDEQHLAVTFPDELRIFSLTDLTLEFSVPIDYPIGFDPLYNPPDDAIAWSPDSVLAAITDRQDVVVVNVQDQTVRRHKNEFERRYSTTMATDVGWLIVADSFYVDDQTIVTVCTWQLESCHSYSLTHGTHVVAAPNGQFFLSLPPRNHVIHVWHRNDGGTYQLSNQVLRDTNGSYVGGQTVNILCYGIPGFSPNSEYFIDDWCQNHESVVYHLTDLLPVLRTTNLGSIHWLADSQHLIQWTNDLDVGIVLRLYELDQDEPLATLDLSTVPLLQDIDTPGARQETRIVDVTLDSRQVLLDMALKALVVPIQFNVEQSGI